MKLKLRTYSKLNLCLQITGIRPDGLHTLDSLVQTIDLSDMLALEATVSGIELLSDCTIDGENIVSAAAQRTLNALQQEAGVRIELEKRIPIGAGLGGGSSNAAATVWGVNELYGSMLSESQMQAVALSLGADVPLFLTGGCQRMQGVGECLEPTEPQEVWYTVLVPPIRCETASIYTAYDALGGYAQTLRQGLRLGDNDLKPAALAVAPALAEYDHSIATLGGAFAGMTGSGSAFFAAFQEQRDAEEATRALEKKHQGARVYTCSATTRGFEVLERTP